MTHIMSFFALVLLLAGAAFSSPIENRQVIPAGCTNITISVTASSSDNIPLPPDLTTANFLLLVNPILSGVLDAVASGTYNIAATYCPGVGTRANTLQILIHGGSYTKAYWFGEYFNPDNSWVSYASSEGYATLTIDRVGNGDSSHPDPITIVQLPYQAEQVHQIIGMARGGTLPLPAPYTGTIFDKIILAGHSLGSVVTNNLNAKYPSDADATLLTGYAIFFPPQFTGVFVQSWLAPAFLDPRFAGYNPGYLEFNNENYLTFLFYAPGKFSQSMADVDFATRGTVSLGEAASVMIGSIETTYTGPVMVITGQHDSIYCSTLNIDVQILLGTPLCDMSANGIVGKAATLYPHASDFKVVFPNAGHCWHLHNNASYTFGIAHDWLASQGF